MRQFTEMRYMPGEPVDVKRRIFIESAPIKAFEDREPPPLSLSPEIKKPNIRLGAPGALPEFLSETLLKSGSRKICAC